MRIKAIEILVDGLNEDDDDEREEEEKDDGTEKEYEKIKRRWG